MLMNTFISSQQPQLDWLLKTRFVQGQTALHLAASGDQDDLVRLLINQFSMSVDDLDDYGRTALYWAAHFGKIQTVKTLVELGANVNWVSSANGAPLHIAVERGHSEIVAFLLECKNIDINIQDYYLCTPLSRAIRQKSVNISKALLARGDIILDIRDDMGNTALDHARSSENKEIEVLILNALARNEPSQVDDEFF